MVFSTKENLLENFNFKKKIDILSQQTFTEKKSLQKRNNKIIFKNNFSKLLNKKTKVIFKQIVQKNNYQNNFLLGLGNHFNKDFFFKSNVMEHVLQTYLKKNTRFSVKKILFSSFSLSNPVHSLKQLNLKLKFFHFLLSYLKNKLSMQFLNLNTFFVKMICLFFSKKNKQNKTIFNVSYLNHKYLTVHEFFSFPLKKRLSPVGDYPLIIIPSSKPRFFSQQENFGNFFLTASLKNFYALAILRPISLLGLLNNYIENIFYLFSNPFQKIISINSP